eukprot:5416-Heterococcus_DN1.PRE.3
MPPTMRMSMHILVITAHCVLQLTGDKAVAKAPPGLVLNKCQKADCANTEVRGEKPFSKCAACSSSYCSAACQKADWRPVHKAMCAQLKRLAKGEQFSRNDAVAHALSRVRLYLCPFFVCHNSAVGPGFVFLQSPNSLLELHYISPVTSSGRGLNRSLLLHYMTMGEFVDAVMQDDFELMTVRDALETAVKECDPTKELVVLLRARCGYLCVVTMPLVPDIGVCRALATDYIGKEALQLNLDEK